MARLIMGVPRCVWTLPLWPYGVRQGSTDQRATVSTVIRGEAPDHVADIVGYQHGSGLVPRAAYRATHCLSCLVDVAAQHILCLPSRHPVAAGDENHLI